MDRRLLVCLFALFFTACQATSQTPLDLIKKPRVPNIGVFPQDIINDALPTGSRYIRPSSASGLSSIDFFNWDEDLTKEVYAFYKDKANTRVGVVITNRIDESFHVVAKVEQTGNDIAFADFIDFNKDGIRDIILGISISGEYFNHLSFYEWRGDAYQNVYDAQYSYIVTEDLDGDANRDILILKLDRNNFADASLLRYSEGKFYEISQLEMDPYSSGYYNISVGRTDPENSAVFIDKAIGSKYTTNILDIEDNQLQLLFDEGSDDSPYTKLMKALPINSQDVNYDGVFEIGTTIVPRFYEENFLSNQFTPFLEGWYNLTADNAFRLNHITYTNEADGYQLILPDKWVDAYTKGSVGFIKSRPNATRNFVNIYYTPTENTLYKLYSLQIIDTDQLDDDVQLADERTARVYTHSTRQSRSFIGYSYQMNEQIPAMYREQFRQLTMSDEELRSMFIGLE